jgi:hypothetical protein
MKKGWIIIGTLVGIFIIIQFFRPDKNDTVKNPQNDINFAVEIPTLVRQKLVNACYDCHSEKTKYPIYNRIAPVSWLLANHIKEGKEHLNFSDWTSYDRKKQIKLLNEICEVIENGEMPMKGYVLMHSSAVINPKEKEVICAWAEQAAEQVMNKID